MSAHSPSIVQGQSTQEENVQEGWDVVNGELKVVIAELRQLVSISTNKASTECLLTLQNLYKMSIRCSVPSRQPSSNRNCIECPQNILRWPILRKKLIPSIVHSKSTECLHNVCTVPIPRKRSIDSGSGRCPRRRPECRRWWSQRRLSPRLDTG